MEISYFNLSGGINQSLTKTELGAGSKVMYWSDAENVEIYNNRGLIKQKGNTLFLELPEPDKITGMAEMEDDDIYKLVITTAKGKIYVYSEASSNLTLVSKTITGQHVIFENFLSGMIIATESDSMFYLKNNNTYDTVDCNLKNHLDSPIYPDCVSVYKGRVWCVDKSTIYYSALGRYDDFKSPNDAGYINDFHTDTADIISMKPYKDYLAIYKKERVYLLSGSNPENFAIVPFADKGSYARNAVVNVDNKQYFLSNNGIFALEQVGELNQIRLGSEISLNIKSELGKFDNSKIKYSTILHNKNKSQMWFFIPYFKDDNFHTILINDYVNRAWLKRVIPQKITTACNYKSYILTADEFGKIYYEDLGPTFNGEPIKFMWKSPFLSLGDVHHRKLIDEFYFLLDDLNDNKFECKVYKDYDSRYSDDKELISVKSLDQMLWAGESTLDNDILSCWPEDNSNIPVWSIGSDVMEKAEICGSCYSVQICIEGNNSDDNCAIIGLQFREIYKDD